MQGAEPERYERVAALIIANELGTAASGMIVVVDEADASTRYGSKYFCEPAVIPPSAAGKLLLKTAPADQQRRAEEMAILLCFEPRHIG
jgi:hypothetical protein